MKTLVTFFLTSLLAHGAAINFKDFSETNAVNDADLLLVDISLGGGSFRTKIITIGNLFTNRANGSVENFYTTNIYATDITTTTLTASTINAETINIVTNLYVSDTIYTTNLFATYINIEQLIVNSNILVGGFPVTIGSGSPGYYAKWTDTNSLGDGGAYVDTDGSSVFTGTGGNVLNNWLQLPFLSDGALGILGGYVTNISGVGLGNLIGNLTAGRIPVASGADTLIDSPMYVLSVTNVATDGHLVFGPGDTNHLYRSGGDLIWTNGLTSGVSLQVRDGGANVATFGTDSGGNAQVASGAGKTVKLSPDNSSEVYFATSTGFYPNSTNLNLGLLNSAFMWGNSLQSGTHYNYGFLSGAAHTNYSRLALSHTGTNGAAILDSQSSGTAGDPRPIQIQHGTTNHWSFNPDATLISWGITKAMKTALTPTNGMVVYQTDNTPGFRAYVNGSWVILNTSADP